MTTLADLNKRAMQYSRDKAAELAYYRKEAEEDELMTTDRKARYLDGWTAAVNKKYTKLFEELKEEAEYVARQITRDADRVRPKFDADSTAELTRTEQAWRNIVLPQLEKGRTLTQALKGADRDAVLGAERFAAGWMNANRSTQRTLGDAIAGVEPQDYTGDVQAAITGRYADLAVTSEDADVIRASGRLDNEMAAFQRVHHISQNGGSGLEAGVISHYAKQDAPIDDEAGDAA